MGHEKLIISAALTERPPIDLTALIFRLPQGIGRGIQKSWMQAPTLYIFMPEKMTEHLLGEPKFLKKFRESKEEMSRCHY